MVKKILTGLFGSLLISLGAPLIASALGVVTVTPTNTQGWAATELKAGATYSYVTDPTSPMPAGALQLTTSLDPASKVQYMHSASNTPLASVVTLSYATKQVSGPALVADPSYQLPVYLNGASGFTTLVFEPYQNPQQGPIVPNTWQNWDVSSGKFWSTRTVTCSGGTILGTPGGPAVYTLAQIKATCPSAIVLGYGVNVGSNNPSWVVRTDAFNFNGTIYDFQNPNTPTDKHQCKHNGYLNYTNATGQPFTSQKDCKKFVKAQSHTDKDKDDKEDNHQDSEDNDD